MVSSFWFFSLDVFSAQQWLSRAASTRVSSTHRHFVLGFLRLSADAMDRRIPIHAWPKPAPG
jgi:hypothetical protein